MGIGISYTAVLASAVVLGSPELTLLGANQISSTTAPSHTLQKRDAYTCYGSDASVTDCRAALSQLEQLGDQNFKVYSGVCLNWSQDSCNVRFCAQPFVSHTVNRTASWIYHWANNTLMDCVHGGQYAVMGDSSDLNGNMGTYRVHVEFNTLRHG